MVNFGLMFTISFPRCCIDSSLQCYTTATSGRIGRARPAGIRSTLESLTVIDEQSVRERTRALLGDLQADVFKRVLRVLIAEDHAVVRQAIALLLQYHEQVEVVGQAAGGREAV